MKRLLAKLVMFSARTAFVCLVIFVTFSLLHPNVERYLPVQVRGRGQSLRHLKRMIERRYDRPANEIGKNHEEVRKAFEPVVATANRSTVVVLCDGQPSALGTAISSDRILTKASLLEGRIVCRVRGQGKVKARLVAKDKSCDLALLELPGANLTPVTFAPTATPPIGTWVITPNGRSEMPLSVGIVSARQRFIDRDAALLGIFMESASEGPRVAEVMDGSAAEAIGLQRDDTITHLAGNRITTRQQLIDGIHLYSPGDIVEIQVLRSGESLKLKAPLTRMNDIMAAEQGFNDHMGGPLSQRRSGFPEVIQHDGIVLAHQCGGPLLNLDGQVQGINIARTGRVSTFALPSTLIQQRITELGWNSLSFANSQ